MSNIVERMITMGYRKWSFILLVVFGIIAVGTPKAYATSDFVKVLGGIAIGYLLSKDSPDRDAPNKVDYNAHPNYKPPMRYDNRNQLQIYKDGYRDGWIDGGNAGYKEGYNKWRYDLGRQRDNQRDNQRGYGWNGRDNGRGNSIPNWHPNLLPKHRRSI